MNHSIKYTLFVLTLLSFIGITNFSSAQVSHFDSLKVAKEIDDQNKIYSGLLARSDAAGIANMYTVDARIMSYDTVSTIGRTAIMHSYHKMISFGITKFSYVTTGLWGSDDNFVVEDGTLTFALADGKVMARGRYLLVWKRENGELKIFRDTFFSDTK